jgi:hypothetical protein
MDISITIEEKKIKKYFQEVELYLSIKWFAVAILDGNFPMMGAAITPKNLLVFFSFSKEKGRKEV